MRIVSIFKPFKITKPEGRPKNVFSKCRLFIRQLAKNKIDNLSFDLKAWLELMISFLPRVEQILHRNLVYLASVADPTQNVQQLLPVFI